MKNSLKYKNNKGQIITGHTVQYLSISILKIVENLFILSYTNLNGHCDSSLVQLQFMWKIRFHSNLFVFVLKKIRVGRKAIFSRIYNIGCISRLEII